MKTTGFSVSLARVVGSVVLLVSAAIAFLCFISSLSAARDMLSPGIDGVSGEVGLGYHASDWTLVLIVAAFSVAAALVAVSQLILIRTLEGKGKIQP